MTEMDKLDMVDCCDLLDSDWSIPCALSGPDWFADDDFAACPAV